MDNETNEMISELLHSVIEFNQKIRGYKQFFDDECNDYINFGLQLSDGNDFILCNVYNTKES